MLSVQHLIETRFSLRGRDGSLTRTWLDYRLGLLRKLTIPSVAAQTTESFTWLLFCDETTDPEILEQLRELESELPVAQVAIVGEGGPRRVVEETVRPETDVLVTTRLDSDDAIADGYVELVQSYATCFHRSAHRKMVVNCPRGYRLDTCGDHRLYRDWMLNSPFHSFFERPRHGPPETVLAFDHEILRTRYAGYKHFQWLREGKTGGHNRLSQHYPTHQDESMAAWLILVHGGNVANRIPPAAIEQPADRPPGGFTFDWSRP